MRRKFLLQNGLVYDAQLYNSISSRYACFRTVINGQVEVLNSHEIIFYLRKNPPGTVYRIRCHKDYPGFAILDTSTLQYGSKSMLDLFLVIGIFFVVLGSLILSLNLFLPNA